MTGFNTKILFVVATLLAAVVALDQNPLSSIPYCTEITNGFLPDADGVLVPANPAVCEEYISFAIFLNGQERSLNLTEALDGYTSFWTLSNINSTENPAPAGLGVLFDFGPSDCNGGFGLTDGTYDTVDGAMEILFDKQGYGSDSDGANITSSTCSPNSFSFVLPQPIPNGLTLKRTFYVPNGPSEAWGRVVDEVTNPTSSAIQVNITYFNNVGSDDSTYFFNVTERYSFSGDAANEQDLDDNLVSIHWSSWNATNPTDFIVLTDLTDGIPDYEPFSVGADDVMPNWVVMIEPGQTLTFMMILNQGGYDVAAMYESVDDIDTNPLKLYAGMTDDQISTLYNFNACVAKLPPTPTIEATSECTVNGGTSMFDLTEMLALAVPAEAVVSVYDSQGTKVATSSGTTLAVPAGTFTAKFIYGQCEIDLAQQFTVECPAAPVAPTAAPEAAPVAAPVTTPQGNKASSASTLVGFGASLMLLAVF